MKTPNKKKGGSKKHGRNKRPVDQTTSFYVRKNTKNKKPTIVGFIVL